MSFLDLSLQSSVDGVVLSGRSTTKYLFASNKLVLIPREMPAGFRGMTVASVACFLQQPHLLYLLSLKPSDRHGDFWPTFNSL